MARLTINQIRHLVRILDYVVSTHAAANLSSSRSMSSDHLCAYCGGSAVQIKQVTRSFGKGAALLIIEAIPMFACPDCGESYFSAQTLHEIERIKALRKSVAVSRSVPVAAFA